MKTTVEANKLSKRADVAREEAAAFPYLNCNHHTVALPHYRGGCVRRPRFSSFQNISGEYFRNEARYEFCLEAMAFVAIVVTTAIPILNNMHALADYVRAIGRL
jgi:hypothetical protein